ncbi:calcium-activated chloride channel regulator 1-like, partial [Python bivittatus]|uniref:Calcium-activated chloride channel regulator 1-like n=1 Tax=Python bivittatus TaxID=176946 RepID=A0A9F5IMM3_PYTBI
MGHSQEILVVLVILCGVMGTMIKLNNGGFEDIVIAINPNIPEDKRIIGNIKSMVKKASRYLFSATKQRFYFKSVKVIVPFTWIPRKEYKKPTIETYENADVIIAGSNLKYGDDPYTLQYGTCGVPGQYIHFTPNFLTDDNLITVYGPRGRVFVHEWAHLRWGVFDEYNRDALFYTDGKKKIEATRCSADISGRYVFPTRRRKFRKCWFQRKTQLYNPGCQFVPDKNQNISSSIMYLQSLPFVTQFCDKSNHNIKATNMQNKICNCRSTWEVIMNSPDFMGSLPITSPPPDPTISVMQTQDRVLGLVLDVSETMNEHNRINRLKQAATLFLLQYIETGSWVGITTFQSSAQIKVYLQQIVNDKVRQGLSKFLPTIASGESDICAGINEGIKVQKATFFLRVTGYEIVLLTSGSNITISSCLTDVKNSGSIIHIISLGSSVANELDTLAIMTGGFKFTCSDSLNSNDLIDAFTGISSRSRDITQQTIQLESESEHIDGYRSLEGIVSIDYTVGMNTFFVVTWSENNSPPQIILKDPKGHKYYHGDFVVDTNIKLARLKINGLAK